MNTNTLTRKALRAACVPLLVLIGLLAMPQAAGAAVRDTPNITNRYCVRSGGYTGMLVAAQPYVSDSQNTWAFVRYRHHYPGRYWSIGGESPMFAFQTNRSNPTLWMYHKGLGTWVSARSNGYRVPGHVALGNPSGGQIIQDTFIPRNGRWDTKSEVVLNC